VESNAHKVNYSPSGKIKAKDLNIRASFHNFYKHTRRALGIVFLIISLGKIYYDPKHPAVFGSVAKLVKSSESKKRDVK